MNLELFSEISIKIDEIKNVFDEFFFNNKDNNINNDYGLMGGSSGVILFYFYYYRKFGKEENIIKATTIIQQMLSDNSINSLSFCNGSAGIGWLLYHIKENFSDIVTFDVVDLFDDFQEPMIDYMFLEINKGRYDYLHNSLGVGMYILQIKENNGVNVILEKLISKLISLGDIDEKARTLKWEGYLDKQGIGIYNLGLSHGVPSILIFLCKCHNRIGHSFNLKKHIQYIVNFLLNCKNEGNISIFPYSIHEPKIEEDSISMSRLAWCYGDLGVIISLIHANRIIKDNELSSQIQEMIDYNCNRINLEENMVRDAGLCHGTVGIAHIFNSFYREYKKEKYKDVANFWYQQTIDMSIFKDGLAGYKAFYPANHFTWSNAIGLLEGVSGIGLGLIASIDEDCYQWDKCLLIS